MGTQAIEGGYDTARVSTVDQQYREEQQRAARRKASTIACNLILGPGWETVTRHDPAKLRAARAYRDEIAAALGLTPRKADS